ncbi:autophagy protein atg9 [Dinochytrium kinnereticum]|nr:autophagy protein atg9 [Dinochytrium kinnereticum]
MSRAASFDEPPLPFAFANSPHLNAGPSTSEYQNGSMMLHHVNEEIPPDDSQLESQRLEMHEEFEDSDDEEAPNDLMIEMNPLLHADRIPNNQLRYHQQPPRPPPPPQRNLLLPRFQTEPSRRSEDTTRRHTRNQSPRTRRIHSSRENSESLANSNEQRKQEVLKMWSETENLDELLESGFTAMLLSRTTNLLILAFIIGFAVFLSSCVDYSLIGPNKILADVIRNDCVRNVHGLPATFLILFSIWWLWQIIRLIIDTPKLLQLKLFYELVLEIPEAAMDTLTWREVVVKVAKIKDIPNSNPNGRAGLDKLDAHSIANRILRKENYLISIFNKDILDLSVPYLGKRQILTQIMEWNLSFCILSYVFDEKGEVRKRFLKSNHRVRLVAGLQKRFAMMAFLNLLFAPFLIVLLILFFFFRYAEEYTKNPSQIGARQYSPFAWWKFREFNELPHLYQERLNRSYKKATRYMEQFPKEKIIIVARFVSFVTGSFAAALAVLALVDKQFLEFEITSQRSVFFYIGLFGGLAAAARAMIPEENQVFEPERALREVAEETHYLPDSWRGKLHTEEVKTEFAALFDYKVVLFLQEIVSVVLAPIILYYSLPKCSGDIIDFFREFTVHVDSLGYVCSFAVFNFRAHGNPRYGAPIEGATPRHLSKEGKMEQSFLFFKANNPEWEPDNEGSQYVQNLSRVQRNFMGRGEASTADYMTSTLLRPPKRTVKFGQQSENIVRPISESMMIGSDMEAEDRPLGLFGLLDAIYETNSRGFSRVA